MNSNTFNSLKTSVSEERLAVYRADGADDTPAIARYLYNIALCTALYLLINIFEVTLRNKIDKALEAHFGQTDWNNVIPLQQTEIMMMNDAMLKIKRQGKKYSHGWLVAELTLGFWVALMGRKYNTQAFQFAIIKNCLRGCPANQKSSAAIQKNLSEIRFLRNRIAHHERIAHWKDLKQKHDLILDFIKWLNPDMHKIAFEKDTFGEVLSGGIAPFIEFVNEKL